MTKQKVLKKKTSNIKYNLNKYLEEQPQNVQMSYGILPCLDRTQHYKKNENNKATDHYPTMLHKVG